MNPASKFEDRVSRGSKSFRRSFARKSNSAPAIRADRYGVGEKMTLAIDINSNMVRAIKERLSDMEVLTARGAS